MLYVEQAVGQIIPSIVPEFMRMCEANTHKNTIQWFFCLFINLQRSNWQNKYEK